MLARQRQIILAALAVAALVLASCATATAPLATSETTADKAKPYGSLTIASGGFGEGNIDPQIADVESFRSLGSAIFDSLLWYTPDGALTGGIAERWEIAPDGKTFTFYVRKGVKFHDGSDLTGADVKFSIERNLDPKVSNTFVLLWRPATDKVEIKDDYTVTVRLKTPQFEIMRGMDDLMGAVVPKKYIEAKGEDYFRKNPIGSGPWKVTGIQSGAYVDLQAVESHWRALPKFEKIRLLNVKEEATVVAQLKTGELDMAVVGPDSAASLGPAGVRVVSPGGGARFTFTPFYDMAHPEKYAFGDLRVRKALQISINAKEMADKLFRGYGRPFIMMAISEASYFYDPSQIKIDAFDAEGAKKLLAEAGYPTGFETKFLDSGGGSILSIVNQATAGYWRKVGINAEIVPMEQAAVLRIMQPQHKPEIWNTIWSYRAAAPREFEYFASFYHSTRSNKKVTNIPRLNELIDLVPATADPAKKKQLAVEAAVLAKNSYSADMAIVEVNTIVALSPKVGAVTLKRPVADKIRGFDLETITHAK